MVNQVVLVGRVVNMQQELFNGNDKKYTQAIISVNRSYKNDKGLYETDLMEIKMYDTIATNFIEYCQKNDLIGVKGRLEVNNNNKLEIIVEKLTFLKSN